MGIKLMCVPGDKLLEYETDDDTHDFIMVNKETLAASSLKMAGRAINAITASFFVKLIFAFQYFFTLLKSLKKTPCVNLLTTQYWSQLASAFGDHAVVKYSVIPKQVITTGMPFSASPNFLSDQLEADLLREETSFDFAVQFQTDPATMPIENPSIAWSSPMVKLATIRIPRQKFKGDDQQNFGEDLSYNPWHCLKEHEPLGGISRVRREVYAALNSFRHDCNDEVSTEPNPDSFKPTLL